MTATKSRILQAGEYAERRLPGIFMGLIVTKRRGMTSNVRREPSRDSFDKIVSVAVGVVAVAQRPNDPGEENGQGNMGREDYCGQ